MSLRHKSYIFSLLVVIAILVVACSSDDSNNSSLQKRSRRSATDTSETTGKHSTLPSISTSTLPGSASTNPITTVAFMSPSEIAANWPKKKLCSLVSDADSQKILAMTTPPTAFYSFSASTGATCTFASGEGDEMYIQLSTSSYNDARSVDSALNAEGKFVVISGVGGVLKKNKATGTTYELNVSGAASNQWIINAPGDKQAEDFATVVLKNLP